MNTSRNYYFQIRYTDGSVTNHEMAGEFDRVVEFCRGRKSYDGGVAHFVTVKTCNRWETQTVTL